MSTAIDYKAVLAGLKARLIELDAERRNVESAIKVFAPLAGQGSDLAGMPLEPTHTGKDVAAPDDYSNDTIVAAAERYLAKVGKPQGTSEICDALKAGGINSVAENFYRTVYSILSRSNAIEKVKDGWALALRLHHPS